MATQNTRTADSADVAERALAPLTGIAQGWAESVERSLRFQQAVAGDWLEFGIEHLRAAAATRDPGALLARQAEINTKFGEQAGRRSQELLKLEKHGVALGEGKGSAVIVHGPSGLTKTAHDLCL